MKRIYHPFHKLEDIINGMWRNVPLDEQSNYRKSAAEVMQNPAAFLKAMRSAVEQWPVACEFYFSNPSINHQAWIGHAGCCIAVGSPEDITRQAWHILNQSEQDAANAVADIAISEWHKLHAEKTSRD